MNARTPIEHDLKCHPGPFDAVIRGLKPYEIRVNDRDYRVGDTLLLREWKPPQETESHLLPGRYTKRSVRVRVTYMTGGGEWGLPKTLCVLGIVPTEQKPLLATMSRLMEEMVRVPGLEVRRG